MHLLVTGANGFVGRQLCRQALAAGHRVTGLVRRPAQCPEGVIEWVFDRQDFIGLSAAWPPGEYIDGVIHLAARVHQMHETGIDTLALYRASNVEGSLRVAEAARDHGVARFVFVSSVKALGETDPGHPWRETDTPAPVDAYGRSKLEAELALHALGRATAESRPGARPGLGVTVVRPPLVYGPGVQANFRQLLRAVGKGMPLPLGAAHAKRSLVYVANLADALLHCVALPAAVGKTFHVTDGQDLSVTELVSGLGRALQRPARLIAIPPALLRSVGRIAGRSQQVSRLLDSLRLDTALIERELGWRPPFSVEQGLAATADWFEGGS